MRGRCATDLADKVSGTCFPPRITEPDAFIGVPSFVRDSRISQVVLRVCALVALGLVLYLPWLGVGGLAYTEGHRAIPAHEMLAGEASGGVGERVLVTTMFDRPYLRKTPGTPWAIAGSTWALGQLPEGVRPGVEFAARLPSALATIAAGVAVFLGARRWFPTPGDRAAVYAGALHLLLPVYWEGARTAEIEGLNTGMTAIGAVLLVHTLVFVRTARAAVVSGTLAGVFVTLAMLAKGPASVPVFVAAFLAAGWTRWWSARRGVAWDGLAMRRNPGAWIAAGLPLAVGGVYLAAMSRLVAGLDEAPVLQSPSEFMWTLGRLPAIAALWPTGVGYAMPAALALVFPWGRGARAEASSSEDGSGASVLLVARALALTMLLALGIYAAFGVHNPRYAIPALVTIAPLAAYVGHGYATGAFGPARRRIAWHMGARSWWTWPTLLAVGMVGYIAIYEQPRRGTSGREPASALASAIAGASEGRAVRVYADEMVEARPELLWYALRRVHERGGLARGRWASAPEVASALQGGALAVVRTDADSDERGRLAREFGVETVVLHEGRVHRYDFALVRAGEE